MTAPNPLDQFVHVTIEACRAAVEQTAKATDALQQDAHRFVERGTETLGQATIPLAESPLVSTLTKLPMLRWFAAALGQVDVDKVHREVQALKLQHLHKTRVELVQQVIQETALKAAGIGLATNILPPIAVALFAVDIAVLSSLQAEMIYRIAALYDLPLNHPTRRGEVLSIYGLSLGGSSLLKIGLALPELIPGLGAVIGASSDAALLYTLGQAAAHFYETKQDRTNSTIGL